MPRASKPKGSAPAETPAAVEPAETPEPAEEPGESGEPGFENRAARRARGKGSSGAPQQSGKTAHFGGRGAVQGPRQYGTRRSG